MNYRLLFSTAWKLISQSELIWGLSLIDASAIGIISLIPNSLVKYLFYLIIWTLFGIWLSFIVYSLALSKNVNSKEIWRVTKSLFFSLYIIYAFSFLIFFIILSASVIFYFVAYMVIFNVSTKLVPLPDLFISILFVEFFSYLTFIVPATFSFLDAVIKQSSAFVSYSQAIRILIRNIGRLFGLAFLFAIVSCFFHLFSFWIIQSGLSVDAVMRLNLENAASFLGLPEYRIMNVLFSFMILPFYSAFTVLSYLNFTGQMSFQSKSE